MFSVRATAVTTWVSANVTILAFAQGWVWVAAFGVMFTYMLCSMMVIYATADTQLSKPE